MKLYKLGIQPGYDSKTIFHAMAYAGMEGFIVVSPKDPIVSLGYFQELNSSLNINFCKESNLMLMRREVGGGTVLLDKNQIFYQIVFKKDNKNIPQDTLKLYKKLSQPVIDTYRDLGIKVKYKEVNDLITADNNKKISGEGGANIGDMKVFVGSIILDFEYELMSKIFPAPNEKFRMQLLNSLNENMSTVKREIGYIPPRKEVIDRLVNNYNKIIGPLEEAQLPEEIIENARELEKTYTSDDFLSKKGKYGDSIKIASGINVYRNIYKAVGGRINTIYETKDNVIDKISINGEFTFLPKEKLTDLEKELKGCPLKKDKIINTIDNFIQRNNIDCPGVTAQDFASAIIQ